MPKFYNMVCETTETKGFGPITLSGTAVQSFHTFERAGVINGDTVTYCIEDRLDREIGHGVYTAGSNQLTRTVLRSTNNNQPINLSGSATVSIVLAAEDIAELVREEAGRYQSWVFTTSGTWIAPADSSPLTVYRLRMVAAGGGGGGCGAGALSHSGYGGGAGEYVEGTFTGITPNQNITVTCSNVTAAGGTAAGGSGATGGNSALGTPVNCVANGGVGGGGSTGSTAPAVGTGGSNGANGTLTVHLRINGQTGDQRALSPWDWPIIGPRGGSPGGGFGIGARGQAMGINTNALAGVGYGSGGGGGARPSTAGAVGGRGLVIIERIWR